MLFWDRYYRIEHKFNSGKNHLIGKIYVFFPPRENTQQRHVEKRKMAHNLFKFGSFGINK